MTETFGQWLKAKREERSLTLRDVERITEGKVSNALLSQIENGGVKRPGLVTVLLVSAALSLDDHEVCERARTGNHMPEPPPVCPTCGQVWR